MASITLKAHNHLLDRHSVAVLTMVTMLDVLAMEDTAGQAFED